MIRPEYKIVVAINDDTLYASAFLDLTVEPVILTIPPYQYIYSISQPDYFDTIINTGIVPSAAGGTYVLAGPNFDVANSSQLPKDAIIVKCALNHFSFIVRADKYYLDPITKTYKDVQSQASTFRLSLKILPLSNYTIDPNGGGTHIEPLKSFFAFPTKRLADYLVTMKTEEYLDLSNIAMLSPKTEPLSSSDNILIQKFTQIYHLAKLEAKLGELLGMTGYNTKLNDILFAARKAFDALQINWKTSIVGNNWIHTNNLGNWSTNYLDRASGSEFILYGNVLSAAYYAHAFVDSAGNKLDDTGIYTITFPKSTPQYSRFWSITMYTPIDIELAPNGCNKYLVASYTPGLVTNPDGSITVKIQKLNPGQTKCDPNTLPTNDSPSEFNVMLRVYGPQGTAAAGTYVPPPVIRINSYPTKKPTYSYPTKKPSYSYPTKKPASSKHHLQNGDSMSNSASSQVENNLSTEAYTGIAIGVFVFIALILFGLAYMKKKTIHIKSLSTESSCN